MRSTFSKNALADNRANLIVNVDRFLIVPTNHELMISGINEEAEAKAKGLTQRDWFLGLLEPV